MITLRFAKSSIFIMGYTTLYIYNLHSIVLDSSTIPINSERFTFFTFESHLEVSRVLCYTIALCITYINSCLPTIVAYLTRVICFSINMTKMRVTR